MRFVYYSEKTVSQCMLALNERLHTKSGRLEGWVEKSGRFSLATTSPVFKRFPRSTRLNARVEREDGLTVIRGYVPDGADPRSRVIIYAVLVVIGLALIVSGNLLPGLIVALVPLPLNIPLEGDYINSQKLSDEVQRTLKAKATLPAALRKERDTRKAAKESAAKRSGSKADFRTYR
ncbi:MAG: hypothetical protein JNM70_03075 [Anaerolineae bacterium]|nr:hypothetical protein [Anaerolineae bacterium]